MPDHAEPHRKSITGALLGGGLLAVCGLAAALLLGARAVDRLAQVSEQEQLTNGVASRIGELQASVTPQVDWDDAVANLDRKFDRSWADANLGAYLTQTAGFQRVYLLDREDRVAFAVEPGEASPAANAARVRQLAGNLIATLRTREAQRGPFRLKGPSKAMISKPIQASAVVRMEGAAWILSASLVQPDFGVSLPSERAPIVIAARAVDGRFVDELSRRYLLKRARIAPPGPAPAGLAQVMLQDTDGQAVAALRWEPRRPGAALLHQIRAPLAVALLLLLASIVVLHRVALRSLGQLLQTQSDLEEAARRAEASERAKTAFIANVSHEIRTPLNGVVGVAELLSHSPLNPEQRQLVETIRASGDMLDRLLMDALDMSKIEAGRLQIDVEPFALKDEVETIAALWRTKAEASGLTFRCEVEPDAAVGVLGDSVRLRQILSNLLSNAVKFTQAGSVTLTASREDGRFVFRVSDTGIGFDDAAAARLFERFEQADQTITRRFGGTGLGLAICRELATLMGGSLTARGEPGVGAVFTLELPLPLAEAPEETGLAQAFATPLRVLAADDHEVNRRIVQLMLEMMGASVTLAADGAEAVELLLANPFDLVLMDMQMPGVDGLAAIREIRRREAAEGRPRMPVIMLSANATAEHVRQALDAGADAHVGKPLKPEVLLREIEALPLAARAAA
jgi:signal transduction histidine kinase/ActR/RegA family two-component response regulator